MSNPEYKVCRRSLLGHDWEFVDIPFQRPLSGPRVWRYRLSKRCARCGTICHLTIDVYGEVAQRQYVYPEGYRYAPEEEPPTSEDLRLWAAEKWGTNLE